MISKALVVAALVAGAIVVPAQQAQAVWQCRLWTEGNPAYRANATCSFGTGGVRVAGYCWDGWQDIYQAGPWRPAGQTSTIICGGGRVLDGAWYETF